MSQLIVQEEAQARARGGQRGEIESRFPARRVRFDEKRVALGLGCFSIGLGLAEVVAPKAIARLVGSRNGAAARKNAGTIRGFGIREMAAGVGILAQPRAAGWLWARVAGDALDLAALGSLMFSRRVRRGNTWIGIASVAGVTAVDVICAQRLTCSTGVSGRKTVRGEGSILVNRSPEDTYQFWHNFENLPRFMKYLEAVRMTGERRSHWTARVPGKGTIQWDSEIVNDVPNQRISWRSVPGADCICSGSVDFEPAPGARGTIVRVQLDYGSPAHAFGSGVLRLMGKHPGQIVQKELHRFKQVLETGEVITVKGQSAGRRSSTTWIDELAG